MRRVNCKNNALYYWLLRILFFANNFLPNYYFLAYEVVDPLKTKSFFLSLLCNEKKKYICEYPAKWWQSLFWSACYNVPSRFQSTVKYNIRYRTEIPSVYSFHMTWNFIYLPFLEIWLNDILGVEVGKKKIFNILTTLVSKAFKFCVLLAPQ